MKPYSPLQTPVSLLPVSQVRSPGSQLAYSETATPSNKAMMGVCAAGACAFLNLYATQPLLPFLVQYFHTSKANAALTVSISTLAIALSAPFIGAFADRIGRKRIIVPAIFLSAVPTLFAAASSNLSELIFWRFVQGLILPAIFAIAISYVTEEWHGAKAGSAMATYVSGNVIGGFVGRLAAGMAADCFGWRIAFVALSACTIFGGILTCWLLPASRNRDRSKAEGQVLLAIPMHLRNPKLLITFGLGASVLFSLVAVFTFINYYLAAAPYYFSSSALSALFGVFLVGAFITPFSGKLIDKLGFRKAYAIALSFSLVGLLMTLSPHLILIIVGLAIFCVGAILCQSSTTSSLRVFAPKQRAAATGLYACLYYLGGSMGGYLPSLFWESAGWIGCVSFVAVVQLGAIVVAWLFWKP